MKHQYLSATSKILCILGILFALKAQAIQNQTSNIEGSNVEVLTPPHGVFTMSNEESNQLGVYRVRPQDGGLDWVGAFDTGGVGFLQQPYTGFSAWTASNCISHHVWNHQQWILVANMGGPDRQNASMSLFKVNDNHNLSNITLTDVVSVTPESWAYSVTGYGDRACVAGAGTSVLVDCFQITADGKLNAEFSHDLNLTIPINVTLRGHAGVASIQFSSDGSKLALLSKGSVDKIFPFSRTRTSNVPNVINPAGIYVYSVNPRNESSSPYGDPLVLEIDPYRRPYDFVWHPSSERLWTVGIPTGVLPQGGSSATTFLSGNLMGVNIDNSSSISEIGLYPFGLKAGCWLEYLNGILYTANVGFDHDVSLFNVREDGSVQIASRRDFPFGPRTSPRDEVIGGRLGNGKRYLYVQLGFQTTLSALEINENDGSLTEIERYNVTGNDGRPWEFFAGVAATLVSTEELTRKLTPESTMETTSKNVTTTTSSLGTTDTSQQLTPRTDDQTPTPAFSSARSTSGSLVTWLSIQVVAVVFGLTLWDL